MFHHAHHPTHTTTATDPVCGMSVDPATAPQHRDTPDGTLHFCSAGCATAFDTDPDRYTGTNTPEPHPAGDRR